MACLLYVMRLTKEYLQQMQSFLVYYQVKNTSYRYCTNTSRTFKPHIYTTHSIKHIYDTFTHIVNTTFTHAQIHIHRVTHTCTQSYILTHTHAYTQYTKKCAQSHTHTHAHAYTRI